MTTNMGSLQCFVQIFEWVFAARDAVLQFCVVVEGEIRHPSQRQQRRRE